MSDYLTAYCALARRIVAADRPLFWSQEEKPFLAFIARKMERAGFIKALRSDDKVLAYRLTDLGRQLLTPSPTDEEILERIRQALARARAETPIDSTRTDS